MLVTKQLLVALTSTVRKHTYHGDQKKGFSVQQKGGKKLVQVWNNLRVSNDDKY